MSSSEPVLRVRGLRAAWKGVPVLSDVTLEVREGELLALMGPNGSGKTTLLRCIVGLETPDSGTVAIDGRDVSHLPPHRRGIGLMFQDPALFPHRTVFENVAYAPLLQRRPRREVDEEVGGLLELLHLSGFEDRTPDRLSGGERQRVALARTLAARPRVVLLDEPFASIDVELKATLRAEFREVLRRRRIAALHVTHDREEGLFLGDRVALLFGGILGTPAPPSELYGAPEDERSARFLGYNVLADPPDLLAIHPDEVRVGPAGSGSRRGEVLVAGPTGPGTLTVVRLDTGERVEARSPGSAVTWGPGSAVGVGWNRAVRLRP